ETRGLGRAFGALQAVADVSLAVPPGELRAVIGPNGAGKTTLFHLVSGLLAPTSGRVLFRGDDVTALAAPARCRRGLSRTFQITSIFPELSVLENARVAVQLKAGGDFRLVGHRGGHPAGRTRAAADDRPRRARHGRRVRPRRPDQRAPRRRAHRRGHAERDPCERGGADGVPGRSRLDVLLAVEALQTFYGKSHVLRDVSFAVPAGEITVLLGRNGAGKT